MASPRGPSAVLVFDDLTPPPLVLGRGRDRSSLTFSRGPQPQSPREFRDDVDMRILESKLELLAIQRDHMRRSLESRLDQSESFASTLKSNQPSKRHPPQEDIHSPQDFVADVDMRALQGKLDLISSQREMSALKRAAFELEFRQVRSHQPSPRRKTPSQSTLDSFISSPRGRRSFSLQRGEAPLLEEEEGGGTGILRSKTTHTRKTRGMRKDFKLSKTFSCDLRAFKQGRSPLCSPLGRSPLGSPLGRSSCAGYPTGQEKQEKGDKTERPEHRRSNLGSHGASLFGSPVTAPSPERKEGMLLRRRTVGNLRHSPDENPLGSPSEESSSPLDEEMVFTRRKTVSSSQCVQSELE